MPNTPDESVRAMNGLCEQIETAITRGELPAETVTELKRAIDDTRTRVWTSMEAARSGDPTWVQEFWLQRAPELCLKMVQRLERGELDHRTPAAGDLRAAAERLVGPSPRGTAPNPRDHVRRPGPQARLPHHARGSAGTAGASAGAVPESAARQSAFRTQASMSGDMV